MPGLFRFDHDFRIDHTRAVTHVDTKLNNAHGPASLTLGCGDSLLVSNLAA